jgi:putative ABC transport system permease protein
MKRGMPTVFGLSVGLPFTLYAWRLRTRAAQELLAVTGIAVGVALVFGVLVANTSIGGSAGSLVHQLIGSAQLQLVARSQQGIDQSVTTKVEALPGVQAASPLLREDVVIAGPKGSEAIQLIGLTVKQLSLDAEATKDLGTSSAALIAHGIGLPSRVAQAIGARPDATVTVRANGSAQPVQVQAVLGSQTIGAVAGSPIGIALLGMAQKLAGEPERVTSVLVKTKPGAQALVSRELTKLAAGHADVTAADEDLALLNTASKPNKQSTTLFAAIAGMVGFLLALNAMLLTTPERRRLVAELRTYGYEPSQIVLLLAVQALILGVVGSVLGIVLGYALSQTLFAQVPSYLAITFPIGAQKVVTLRVVLIALGCGVLAALLASARPLLDLRRGRPVDHVLREQGEAGQDIDRRVTVRLALTGGLLIVIVTALALAVPSFTLLGGVLLAVAAVCLVPLAHKTIIGLLRPLGERSKGVLPIALVELEATATRSIALAAIAGLAVYGSLAIGGARSDLIHGVESAIHQDSDPAQLWVTSGDNVFNTDSFRSGRVSQELAHAPGVASVRADQGALLTVGDRRMLIRGHDANIPAIIQSTQLVQGDFYNASRLIRRGGWATISQGFAAERHLDVGDRFSLPAPSGALPLRVAAITTNLGWPAGAVTFSTADYARGWQSTDPTALEVNLRPGISLAAGKRTIQAALGSRTGLLVQTVDEREAQADSDLRQGLSSLGQISTLLLITGALAVAASLGAAIWQRRARLAAMKTWGYDNLQLWRSLLLEGTILLTIGCIDGALLGLYGHALADRWLRLTTDFPAPFSIGAEQVVLTLALVICMALAVIALPGFAAARVSPSAGFQE